jgi:type VI secretion system protein ImpL
MPKTWGVASVGLLAFAVLVWFAGPLLVIGAQAPLAAPSTRALVIAVFCLQYVLQKAWSLWRARSRNERIVAGLMPSEAALSAEGVQLRERFTAALAELKGARFAAPGGLRSALAWKFGRSYLYQLPWYMIIGAPGAGKTTALLNSGLSFPLSAKLGSGPVAGFGGTRNCDWWFSDRAVLIDTAGRYTTHDSDAVADRKAWQEFLALLRRSRPRRPLNGVLVAVSMQELSGFTAAERAEHARTLRSRLDEVQSSLGVRLPVYVVLTKCDLLPGFVDWFGNLNRAMRDDVWGVTFDLRASDSGAAAAQFAGAFENLVDALTDGMVPRLQAERDLPRRTRILMLPSQLRAISESLDALIRGTFSSAGTASSVAPVLLRGVYLTSGTQSGTPIDRMLAAFGRELGVARQILPPNVNSGRSFFLSRLLSDLVFAEAELSGRSPLRQRARRHLLVGAFVLVQLCALSLGTLWLLGYWRSTADMHRLEAQVDRARALLATAPARAEADPRPLLPALDALRSLAASQARSAHSFVAIGSSADRKLAAAAKDAYDRVLLGPLQMRIATAIDDTLRNGTDMNVQYEALKAYAMLRDSHHFDATGIKIFVMAYWDSALEPTLTPDERQALKGHLNALLEAGAVGSGISVEPALIDSVRARLNTRSGAERIAMRINFLVDTERDASPAVSDFTVAALGPAANAVFVAADGKSSPAAVPALYTIKVYRDLVSVQVPRLAAQLASEAQWVLNAPGGQPRVTDAPGGPPQDAAARGGAVGDDPAADAATYMDGYRAAYAQAWLRLLDDLHLKPPANNKEAIRNAQVLAASDGPMARLLEEVVRQTPVAGVGSSAGGALSAANSPSVSGPISPTDPAAPRFVALAGFVVRGTTGASPLADALRYFSEVARARTAGGAASTTSSEDTLARVAAAARAEPEPVRSSLLALATPDESAPGTSSALSRQVATRLGVSCIRLVAGQFPFDRRSSRDTPLQDFASLFGPNGGFDEVFRQLLAGQVDTSSNAWRARPGTSLSADEVERFRAAARIRDVLFAHGSSRPAVELTFRPIDMDPDIDRLELDIDGQTIRYAHGPLLPSVVKWPGAQGQVRISVTPATAGASEAYAGPWALFRLMDHAAMQEQGEPGHFIVVFAVGGRHASFDVTSSSGANPFRLRELERFECPLADR